MPIPTNTAITAISIVSGLVRLAGRIDNIVSEQAALRQELALPGKVVISPPLAGSMKRDLQGFLEASVNEEPDPLSGRRQQLAALLAQSNPAEDVLLLWLTELLPDKVVYQVDDPSGEFAKKLREKRGAWDLDDEEILRLAYYLGAGKDLRAANLPWQLATAVVSVVTEVAVQNQALIFRDDRARPILVAVLSRFSEPDLAKVGSHRALLRFVLKATLNGVLDHPDQLGGDKAWVEGILAALAKVRANTDDGDDFVVGLVHGRGYPLLIGGLLEEGASHLASSDAGQFEAVAAEVLLEASKLVRQKPQFEGFFQDHWGDLLRAGLAAVHSNGNVILAQQSPLLREALLAAIKALAETDGRHLLSSGTLTILVEAAVGAIAVRPELLDDRVHEGWLRELMTSAAGVLAGQGVQSTFSPSGLETLLQTFARTIAEQPELIVENPGLAREVIGPILRALAASGQPRLDVIASAGANAVLSAIAADPALADTHYPSLVAEVARALAGPLQDMRLTRAEVANLLQDTAATIAADPMLIGIEPVQLPAIIVAEVLRSIGEDRLSRPLSTRSPESVVAAALQLLAARPQLFEGRPERISEAVVPVLAELSNIPSKSGEGNLQVIDRLVEVALQGILGQLSMAPALLDSS